jgi:hypothetical protein
MEGLHRVQSAVEDTPRHYNTANYQHAYPTQDYQRFGTKLVTLILIPLLTTMLVKHAPQWRKRTITQKLHHYLQHGHQRT